MSDIREGPNVTSGQEYQEREQDEPRGKVPEHPEARQAETVDALEEQQAGDDGRREPGDDVSANPDTDEMEGLPGPPAGGAGEPSG